jgi:tetratricopeptide (TPR) repeat protein
LTTTSEPVGTLAVALGHAARLLASRPALAEAQAREILAVVPGQADALRLLGQALGRQGQSEPAIGALHQAVAAGPGRAEAWGALADELTLAGRTAEADQAYARQIQASVNDPELVKAAGALYEQRLAEAERLLRPFLKRQPNNVAGLRMLAEVGARLGRYQDAEHLLERCLELAPGFSAARHNYALVLYRQNRPAEAIGEIGRLLAEDPAHPGYRSLKAAALAQIGEYAAAIEGYESVLRDHPVQPKAWMSLGHALKTVGRTPDSIAAYRRSLSLLPSLGEVWWSLANLKTFRFSGEDVAAMRRQLERPELENEDRLHLQFALGKALEDAGRYAESFGHYAEGARVRRADLDYDAEETSAHVRRCKALFTPAFFADREGSGSPASDPIFIVGLPRAGSTLIEQILSSHPSVEGTMELPDIASIARGLGRVRKRGERSDYPEVLAGLDADRMRALGEEYLERTRVQRKLGRPLFIDKMPNNFAHVGLICLILPGAKIIDARRHPLGCCFSAFKQHFARGQGFSYDLAELGRYYADYVALMAHFDAVLPGRIHRVIYEQMIADPEAEVRRLLDYCGLAFDEACLRFHENDRPVRTASSEQVRQPIFTDGVEHWRNYEPWLGPLKDALGPVLDSYPAAPPAAQVR